MNNKIKRSIAILCTAAAFCAPLSTGYVFTGVSVNPIVASAASDVHSGTHYGYSLDNPSEGYTLYFGIPDLRGTTCQVIGCTTYKDSVNIYVPETYTNGNYQYQVDKVWDDAFRDQTRLNSVSLPRYITEIGNSAFMGCTNLKYFSGSAINGNGDMLLTSIGNHAFRNCENAYFGGSTFRNVKNVGRMAFRGCSGLEEIYMPNLETMSKMSFAECYNLKKVDLSESSITSIPENAFEYSSSDRNTECIIKLPSTVQNIGNYAFHNVNGIRKIDVSNATSIGEHAFEDCHSLRTVFTGNNLYWIGTRAFYGCDPMRYFACKNDYVWIGSEALGYDHMRNYTGKKSNFILWGSSNNSNVKGYAASQQMTYKNTSDAASYASTRYTDYEWYKANTGISWGVFRADGYPYYHFENKHEPYANGYNNTKFHGICAGMAAVSALTSSGYLSVSEYAPGYSKLRDVHTNTGNPIPYSVKSYATTVWANTLVEIGRAFDYQTYNYVNSQYVFDREALLYAENITYGADAAVLTIMPADSAGHAVVCFGMEYKNDASDKNDPCWNGWDARLLIYDVDNDFVNGKAHDKADYVYVNLSDGSWYSALISKHGYSMNNTKLALTHSYDRMVNASVYGMTTDQFFAAIRNN